MLYVRIYVHKRTSTLDFLYNTNGKHTHILHARMDKINETENMSVKVCMHVCLYTYTHTHRRGNYFGGFHAYYVIVFVSMVLGSTTAVCVLVCRALNSNKRIVRTSHKTYSPSHTHIFRAKTAHKQKHIHTK